MFDPMFLVVVVAGLMSGGALCKAAGATIEIAKLRQAPADEAGRAPDLVEQLHTIDELLERLKSRDDA